MMMKRRMKDEGGRMKEMRCGRARIYSSFRLHPSSFPPPRGGYSFPEVLFAVVVLGDGATLELTDLTEHCRARLAGFKVPKQLIIRDSLPRNPSGKVLKRVLRAELES